MNGMELLQSMEESRRIFHAACHALFDIIWKIGQELHAGLVPEAGRRQ